MLSTPPLDDRHGFDVVARIRPDATEDQARDMLKTLLIDRFKLKMHLEQRDLEVYVLAPAQGGIKISPGAAASPEMKKPGPAGQQLPEGGAPGFSMRKGPKNGDDVVQILVQNEKLLILAQLLRQFYDKPIVDQSGAVGLYTFTLEFADHGFGTSDQPSHAPELADVLRKQLGLTVTKRKVPSTVVVVDSISIEPTAN